MLKRNRPISPHLLIYTATLNLQRSIFHRFSGLALTLSLVFLLYLTKFFLQSSLIEVTYTTLFLYLTSILFLKNLTTLFLGFHLFSGLQHLVSKL